MARLLRIGAAALLLIFPACAIPVAEAPPEAVTVNAAVAFDSPIDPSVRPEDLLIPVPPTEAEMGTFKARVRRLSPTAFPDLPPAIAQSLVNRDCRIPQEGSRGPLGNVIRGELLEAGKEAWAVICSRDGRSQILAFRGATETEPVVVDEFEDSICLGEEWNCGMLFGTNIDPVGRDYIVTHYEAYGGPEPPPIDHQGINVGIWEKASVVRYFYNGEWLSLTGAD